VPGWATILLIAFGGALLLEGAFYALFPGAMKRAMVEMQNLPENALRIGGLISACIGVLLVVFLIPKT